MIPDEAVEAVARILYARNSEWGQPSWEDAANDIVWNTGREDALEEARELLEAAAPHLAAQTLNEAADDWGNAAAAVWLRSRARRIGEGK
jgi:hypothetical protein